jgi:hypothetical protein
MRGELATDLGGEDEIGVEGDGGSGSIGIVVMGVG